MIIYMNEQMQQTVYWGAIAGAAYSAITGVSSFIAVKFLVIDFGPFGGLINAGMQAQGFGFGSFLSSILLGVIGGAIGGVILNLFFDFWLKLARILVGWIFKITNLFQFYFYPGVTIYVLFGALGLLGADFGGLMFWLINIFGVLIGIYVFATLMEQGVGKYYDPIIQGSASNTNG